MLVFTYLHIWLRVKATFHPKNVKQNTYLRYLKNKKGMSKFTTNKHVGSSLTD